MAFHLADHHHPEDMVILLEEGTASHLAASQAVTPIEGMEEVDFHHTEVEALAAEGSHPAEAERPPHTDLHIRIRLLTTLPSH
jgi:hypothetical protein